MKRNVERKLPRSTTALIAVTSIAFAISSVISDTAFAGSNGNNEIVSEQVGDNQVNGALASALKDLSAAHTNAFLNVNSDSRIEIIAAYKRSATQAVTAYRNLLGVNSEFDFESYETRTAKDILVDIERVHAEVLLLNTEVEEYDGRLASLQTLAALHSKETLLAGELSCAMLIEAYEGAVGTQADSFDAIVGNQLSEAVVEEFTSMFGV